MRRSLRSLGVCVLLTTACVATASGQGRPPELEILIQQWLKDLDAHQPGQLDEAARAIAFRPWDEASRVFRVIARERNTEIILKLAATYLDIAIHIPREDRPEYPTDGSEVLRSVDGRPTELSRLDSQIWSARHLIDRLLRLDPKDRAVRQRALAWYRDVTAIFAARLHFADLHAHLAAAAAQFPDEPIVLFDSGCYAEALASPTVYHATRTYASQNQPTPTTAAPLKPPQARYRFLDLVAQRREAEDLYRRAIAAGASGEAHARLAWLLLQRGRAQEAIPLLEEALKDEDKTVRYYASLFLGYARTDTGAIDDALAAFTQALALFPDAQAPHAGISRVQMRRGTTQQARAALQALLAPRRVDDDRRDPWWSYIMCRGRDLDLPVHPVAPWDR